MKDMIVNVNGKDLNGEKVKATYKVLNAPESLQELLSIATEQEIVDFVVRQGIAHIGHSKARLLMQKDLTPDNWTFTLPTKRQPALKLSTEAKRKIAMLDADQLERLLNSLQ